MPDVIGNWWRTADGEIVLFAANLTDRPQTAESNHDELCYNDRIFHCNGERL